MLKRLHLIGIVLSVMLSVMMWTNNVASQNYTLYFGDHPNLIDVPYCLPCDSIVCVPPSASTGVYWGASGEELTMHGDTLYLPSGFNKAVTCYFDGGNKRLYLRPLSPPISPNFATIDTVCGTTKITLDAGNVSEYGFTTYIWNNNLVTQNIVAGKGLYWVNITNVCGSVSDTITIQEYSPNKPNLGADITACKNADVVLDPGTGYSNYVWFPGLSTDTTLSPSSSGRYMVETTNTVGGCVNRDTIEVTFLETINQNIELVTIDTTDGNNQITWLRTNAAAHLVNVYRESTTNNYILVGTALYSTGKWTDTVSSKNQPWRYKIAIVDTCNNEGSLSKYVQSIHSWVTSVVGGGYTIQWTPYLNEAKKTVNQYNIYYGKELAKLNYLTYVSGNVTVYTFNSFADSIYVIGAQLAGKSIKEDALSNWISKKDAITGISNAIQLDNSIKVYSTPGLITIQTTLIIQDIKLYNSLGQMITSSKEKNITTNDHGLYILQISTSKGILNKKIVQ